MAGDSGDAPALLGDDEFEGERDYAAVGVDVEGVGCGEVGDFGGALLDFDAVELDIGEDLDELFDEGGGGTVVDGGRVGEEVGDREQAGQIERVEGIGEDFGDVAIAELR